MKKSARIIIICILIIGVIVTIIVLKNNKKDTTISNDTNNYDIDDPWKGDDEVEDFEKEGKTLIISMDTLGQDRTFSESEKEFANEIAKYSLLYNNLLLMVIHQKTSIKVISMNGNY